MTREEKIKKLYFETYEDDGEGTPSLEEMEEGLQEFYSAAGFENISIDDLLRNHEVDSKFAQDLESRINEELRNLSDSTEYFEDEAPF